LKFLKSKELDEILNFAPAVELQAKGDRLVLTLMKVEQIVGEGVLAATPGDSTEARRVKRPARGVLTGEKAWWDLSQGCYLARYNEQVSVPANALLVIQPHPEAMKNGLWHPTLFVREWEMDAESVLMVISAKGLKIQEDTPVSVGFVISG